MALNTNKERRVYWEEMNRTYSAEEIKIAMDVLKPDTQTVLRFHYIENLSLQDIAKIIHKSMTVVRTHQVMGMYQLWKYFQKP